MPGFFPSKRAADTTTNNQVDTSGTAPPTATDHQGYNQGHGNMAAPMQNEPKVSRDLESDNSLNGNGQLHQGNVPINDMRYDGTAGSVARFITPGGNPIDNSQPAFPVFHRKFANPAPLGLMGFGATTFMLSMFNVQARGIHTPNLILGMALGYGGLCQLLAGMWEFAAGNTFGATAFSSYGGFWLSFAVIYIPQFGVVAAYGDRKAELASAIGIYLSAWFIVTFIFFIASLRSSIALASLFFFLDLTFLLLFAGEFSGKINVTKAGGGLGIFTAAIAGYIALAGLLTPDTSHFSLPVGDLSPRSRPNKVKR